MPEPMPTAADTEDDRIRRDVLAELGWDARVQPSRLGVAVQAGIVTISGVVDSYTKKWAAEDATLRVKGVRAVANEIEVRLHLASERSDADIAASAVRALEGDAVVPLEKVKVVVSKAWVTLTGEVDWQHQRQDAERVVRRLTGVKGVTNLITVKAAARPADLAAAIQQAMVRSARVDAGNVRVEVHGSKVILEGKVRSWDEAEEAERSAWRAPGISEVENRLDIIPD